MANAAPQAGTSRSDRPPKRCRRLSSATPQTALISRPPMHDERPIWLPASGRPRAFGSTGPRRGHAGEATLKALLSIATLYLGPAPILDTRSPHDGEPNCQPGKAFSAVCMVGRTDTKGGDNGRPGEDRGLPQAPFQPRAVERDPVPRLFAHPLGKAHRVIPCFLQRSSRHLSILLALPFSGAPCQSAGVYVKKEIR